MKKYLFLWISSAILFSCNEDEKPVVCDTANPLEDITWIKAAVEEYSSSELSEYTYLSQASYQGETVFFLVPVVPIVTGRSLSGTVREMSSRKISPSMNLPAKR